MLALNDVEVVYPNGVRALEGVSLDLVAGDFTVLMGPSGAGKSTLLRCMNGLVRPTGGTVAASGTGDIFARGALRRHRRSAAMVFQHHQLIGRLSALSNVLTGRLGYHGQWRTFWPLPNADVALALDCLGRVGLEEQALARVDTLSGGQQQRVGFARALAQQPSVVLADEPVASLDPATAASVLRLLKDICRADGITAVVSLHQVNFALEFADRIVGVAGGAVVFDGAPESLDDATLERIYGRRPAPARRGAAAEAAPSADPVSAPRAAMEAVR